MKTRRLGWLLLVVGSMLAVLGLLLRPNFSASASGRLAAYVSNADDAHPMTLRRTVEISFTPAYTAYLPFISNVRPTPLAGIYGQIRYQGTPVTNTEVQLQRCDNQGTYWQCSSLNRQFTTTDQSGRYQFTAAASCKTIKSIVCNFTMTIPGICRGGGVSQFTLHREYSILRDLTDGESLSEARDLIIRVRNSTSGKFEGIEYLLTLSATVQTEMYYVRQVVLFDEQLNVLNVTGMPIYRWRSATMRTGE